MGILTVTLKKITRQQLRQGTSVESSHHMASPFLGVGCIRAVLDGIRRTVQYLITVAVRRTF